MDWELSKKWSSVSIINTYDKSFVSLEILILLRNASIYIYLEHLVSGATQHHLLHNIICTSSSAAQHHLHIIICCTTSSAHHHLLHNIICCTTSAAHHHLLHNITCTSSAAQHLLHNISCTTSAQHHMPTVDHCSAGCLNAWLGDRYCDQVGLYDKLFAVISVVQRSSLRHQMLPHCSIIWYQQCI